MNVMVTDKEIRAGAKGDYLYVKYTLLDGKSKGKQSGKAIFNQLREKWDMCQINSPINLKLDEKYNVIDILPVELPPPQEPIKPAPHPDEPTPEEIGKMVERTESPLSLRDKSILVQVAYKGAVEIEGHLIDAGKVFDEKGKYPTDRTAKIISRTELHYKGLLNLIGKEE